MGHNEQTGQVLSRSANGRRVEWSNIGSIAIEVAEIRDGVRVELPAVRYNDVVDLVQRERQSCGNWLELDLTRQDGLLLLHATARTDQGRSTIRSLVGFDAQLLAS